MAWSTSVWLAASEQTKVANLVSGESIEGLIVSISSVVTLQEVCLLNNNGQLVLFRCTLAEVRTANTLSDYNAVVVL